MKQGKTVEKPTTIGFHRDDTALMDKLVDGPLEMIIQQQPPEPDLTIQICTGVLDDEPVFNLAVLAKGRLKPEQYWVTVQNLVLLLVQGRPQMLTKEEKDLAESKSKGGIILPPGVEGN